MTVVSIFGPLSVKICKRHVYLIAHRLLHCFIKAQGSDEVAADGDTPMEDKDSSGQSAASS